MKLLEEFGLSYDKISKFERYLDLLLEWNEKFNLTAITDKDEIEEKHFIDELRTKNGNLEISIVPYVGEDKSL